MDYFIVILCAIMLVTAEILLRKAKRQGDEFKKEHARLIKSLSSAEVVLALVAAAYILIVIFQNMKK